MEELLKIEQIARELGRSTDVIKRGIRQGTLPFGVYIRPEKENQKHAYIITKTRYEAWKNGNM